MIQTASFGYETNVPFSVYGDNVFLLLQNFVLIGQVWHFNKEIDLQEKLIAGGVILGYIFILNEGTIVSQAVWDIILNSSTLMSKFDFFIYFVLLRHVS